MTTLLGWLAGIVFLRGAVALGKDALGRLRAFDAWRDRKANGEHVEDSVRRRLA